MNYKKNFSLTVTSHMKSMPSEQKKFMREVELLVKPTIKLEFCMVYFFRVLVFNL